VVKFRYRHEDSPAALASNWWQVLAVDAVLGLVVIALGVVSIAAWNEIVGWILVLLGGLYLLALIGRYRIWRMQRAGRSSDE